MFQRNTKSFGIAVRGLAVAVTALAVSACGSTSKTSSSSSSTSHSGAKSAVRIGLAQPLSPNDRSFGEATHDGAVQAEQQFGIKLAEIDNLTTSSEQLTAVENLARTNALVMMDGGISSQNITSRFPHTQFITIGSSLPAAPNNHSETTDWRPVAYLAGVAAAHESKTHVIGFIGGVPIPPVLGAEKGYTAGAKSVDPSIKVLSTIIGSFTDATEAKGAAQAQIANGADVLMGDLDTAHLGIVEAAKAAGKDVHVIGAVAPKCDISDGLDIGDAVFDQPKITFTIIKTYVTQHTLPAQLTFGLRGGYSSFGLCPGASPSLRQAISSATSGLLSGKIQP